MSWVRRVLLRRKMEQQLEKELRFHLEEHAAELIRQGAEPEEAKRQARLALGGAEQVREQCRDARGTRWLEELWSDFRYALRTLRHQPGFAAVALLTLALGIGATTIIFTLVDRVLLQPLPYPDASRLVTVQEFTEGQKDPRFGGFWAFAYPNFVDCRREARSLDVASWRYDGGTVSSREQAEYVDALEISAEFFPVLRISPAAGRFFLPEEDRRGAAPAAVISDSLWRRLYGGSRQAVGSSILYNEKSFTIVGVTPDDFRFAGQPFDLFTPLGQDTSPLLENRKSHPGINVVARLRAGVKLGEAQSELKLIGRRLEGQYPESNAGRTFVVQPLRPDVGDVSSTLWLLLVAVGLVLLIACANVASLLLARAVSRERELAMRVALGASRGRLARQCLTESAVLGVAGGALGVFLAASGLRPFIALWPGALPRAEEVHLDWRALVFALGVSLVSGILFGLAPALRAPNRELEQVLRAGSRTVVGSSRKLHSAFVVAEIGIAIVLLVAAGMLGGTLLRLSALDPGVDIHNVLITRMALSASTLTDPGRTRAAWQDVLERARSVPGVSSVALVDTVPMRQGNNQIGYWATSEKPEKFEAPLALATSVTPDYLRVMGLALHAGRFFDEHDGKSSDFVVVIDEVLAKNAFPGEDAVGKRLMLEDFGAARVIGVVGHVRHWGLAGDDQAQVRAQLYYAFAQIDDRLVRRWSELMSIAVRTKVEPLSVVEPLRRELRGASGDQVLYEVRTLEQLARASLARQRFLLVLFSVFAGVSLLLACIGIYGVLAYLTGLRVPEIGVRVALGATAREVVWLVLRQSLAMILVGVAVGAFAAWAASRLLLRFVEGMQPTALSAFALTIPVLVGAALLASFLPARKASRIDPVVALRLD